MIDNHSLGECRRQKRKQQRNLEQPRNRGWLR